MGISFTLLLTISYLRRRAPVREELRLDLQSRGLSLAGITVAQSLTQKLIARGAAS